MFDTQNLKFNVINLGCKVNRVESDSLAAYLLAHGGNLVESKLADYIVINSCTVTSEADKKTRKAIRAALRSNLHATIIVTGCGVAIDANAYSAIDSRVKTIERAELFSSLSNANSLPLRYGEMFHTRVNIKVQDGCNHACSYCIVHVARGSALSVPFTKVLSEASRYFDCGTKEIVLTGIDLGSYQDKNKSLAQLVSALLEEADKRTNAGEKPARIRVSSIEPTSIDDQFIDLLARSNGRLCRHVHLPLQSGSTKVLHQMARPYTAAQYLELVTYIRERVPQISLTTDIICGFPEETEDDFEHTINVARQCGFSMIHVFPYSKRPGTPAAERSDQIPESVKTMRAARLRSLATTLRATDFAQRHGMTELALIEPNCALTESYYELPVPKTTTSTTDATSIKVGDLIEMML